MLATGSATDPLGASATDTLTVSTGGATGVRTIKSSFFANRVNFGNPITETTQGPESTPDPYVHLAGPYTLGIKMTVIAAARVTGIRVMKMPAGHGTVTALCWSSSGTLLQSKTQSWSADGGGWREIKFDAPQTLAANTEYYFGYHYPSTDTNWALNTYVWNGAQDICVYPLLIVGTSGPTFYKAGATPTWTGTSTDYNYHNVYVDPMVEWDTTIPGYDAGVDYYDQFPNGGSRFAFPCVIDFADPGALAGYKALGMNTLVVSDAARADVIAAVKAADMDWYPMLHDNNMAGPQLVADDATAAGLIRGYFLTDEPENAVGLPPSSVRVWRNNARKIDSTRPIYINLGRYIIENQGYVWQPPGISAKDVNLQWREYLSLADICSMDGYGIEHTYPYTFQGSSDTHRYGIWIYPMQIHRMRTEMTDGRVPIWGEVETTSAYPSSPTPTNVRKAVWSMLIAGAKGILYFDHRFAGPAVSQDFAAMLNDTPMATEITALNAQMITLADALNAPETNYITSAVGTGTLASAQGGYPSGALIPIHYSTRHAGSTYYFFVQSIRDGSAGTVTVTVPGFETAVLTVIGESRTVTVSVGGTFTDTFTGDYTYHLYSTTTAPVFTAPSNTVAPAITTDGTPQTGETVTCSTGTWTGVPTPTYTFQWQRFELSVWTSIIGATTSAYTLIGADEGLNVKCVVTASNSQGSANADSNTITPAAATPSPYEATVLSDSPVAYWRLKDMTEEIGGYTLTNSGAVNAPSIITDSADGAQTFDSTGTDYLTVADTSALRVGLGSFSVEAWIKPSFTASFAIVTKVSDFRLTMSTSKLRFSPLGAASWYTECESTTTLSAGSSYHVVGTWDATTKFIKIYVNGTLETTVDASAYGYAVSTSGWGDLRMGDQPATLAGIGTIADGFEGTIDEVALYATVLSSTRIAQHYTDGTT